MLMTQEIANDVVTGFGIALFLGLMVREIRLTLKKILSKRSGVNTKI